MKYSKVIQTHAERMKTTHFLNPVQKMHRAVTALENISLNKNPKHTDAMHLDLVSKSALKLKNETANINDMMQRSFGEQLSKVNSDIAIKAGLVVGSESQKEIRQALRQLPKKDRLTAVNKALSDGDPQVIAAINGASELLTGLPQAFAQDMYKAYEKKYASDLVQQRENLEDDFFKALNTVKAVNNAVSNGFDPDQLRKMQAEEKLSNDAQNEFESTLLE